MTKLDFYRLLLTGVRNGLYIVYDAGNGLRFIHARHIDECALDHALTVSELEVRLKGVEE